MIILEKINLYLRILYTIIITIYYAIKVSIAVIFSKNKIAYRKNAVNWSKKILNIFNVRINSIGLENLDSKQTYILAANHSSLFDIPILFVTFKDFNFIIIYKKELEKIPIFGRSLKVSPFVSINRSEPREAMKSIEQTLAQMSENDCPIIFPEGTRSENGELGEFKRGTFLLASKSLKPIVPIAIVGSSGILPKGSFAVKANSEVTVKIYPPIENSGISDRLKEKELMQKVYEQIKIGLSE